MSKKKYALMLLICAGLASLSLSAVISPGPPLASNATLNTTENSTMASPKVDLGPVKSSMLNFLFSHLRRCLKTLFRRFKQLKLRLLH